MHGQRRQPKRAQRIVVGVLVSNQDEIRAGIRKGAIVTIRVCLNRAGKITGLVSNKRMGDGAARPRVRRAWRFRVLLGLCAFLTWETAHTMGFGASAQASDQLKVRSKLTFHGICDGSAAVRLDTDTLLVAYDESNTLFSYDLWGGSPLAHQDMGDMLRLEDDGEMDLEAVARQDDQLWWIGSHGRDGKGKDAPNRKVLFATNIPTSNLDDIEIRAGPMDLTDVLLAHSHVAAVLTSDVLARKPKKGGLNIEGLAAHPQGGLLVGFRSPLSKSDGLKGNAWVVHLDRVGETFKVQQLHELDLDNRGIRDIVRNDSHYVIIAGPVSPGGPFALYRWDGQNEPTQMDSEPFDDLNLEAIVPLKRQWLVLSDDGKVKRPDKDKKRKCDKIRKKRGEKHKSVHFRAWVVGN